MTFLVNTRPPARRQFVTSRNIKERLDQELIHNVALRVGQGKRPRSSKSLAVANWHLSVLIETMRREGFELAVGRPEVIIKEIDGVKQEPYEEVIIDCEEQHQGAIMEELGYRKGELTNMNPDGKGRVRLDFMIPARGLIGFRGQFMTLTSGTGILTSRFDHYGPLKPDAAIERRNGVMVSMVDGKALAYALYTLQDRGKLIIDHGTEVYEGMLVGIHSRANDLVVNPTKGKKLDNMRASGNDENIVLTPPVKFTLEQAIEFLDDDELVEVTPNHIRLRKKFLKENERKRASKK